MSGPKQTVTKHEDSIPLRNIVNDQVNAAKQTEDVNLDILSPHVSIYVEVGVNTNVPSKVEQSCQTENVEKASQTLNIKPPKNFEKASQTLNLKPPKYLEKASQTFNIRMPEKVEKACQTVGINMPEISEKACQTLDINLPEKVERACQTVPKTNYDKKAEVQQESLFPYRSFTTRYLHPKLNKWIWFFEIKNSNQRTYKFQEKYSSIKTAWDIKVRLYHLERVPIEPANQILIYKNRFIKNNELLKNVIDKDDAIIKMRLADRRQNDSNLNDEYKKYMLESLTDMGLDLNMAQVALDATDYNINDALDILKSI